MNEREREREMEQTCASWFALLASTICVHCLPCQF